MPPDDVRLETLLAESEWLRALARRLCADPHEADDLAQEAWLRALRRRPDSRSSPRAWLARVLFNLNVSRARSAARRSRREEGAARAEAQPSSAELAERGHVARALAEQVLALEEPGRSVVLARFFEGLELEEIARRQSRSATVVRADLRAALEELRAKLERNGGAEWLIALAPLATDGQLPVHALRAGRRGPGMLAAAALLLLGSASIVGVVVHLRSGSTTAAPEPQALAAESGRANPAVLVGSAPEQRIENSAPVVEGARVAAPVAAVLPPLDPRTIEGVVLRRAGGEETAIAGAQVLLWDYAKACLYGIERLRAETATELPPLDQARSDSRGGFRFSGLDLGDYLVGVVVAGASLRTSYAPVRDPPKKRIAATRLAVVFGEAGVHGCVRDEEGVPLAGVRVNIYLSPVVSFDSPYFEMQQVSMDTGADGRYAIDALPSGSYTLQVGPERTARWPSRRGMLKLVAADSVELDVGENFPVPHWRGTLRCAQGGPTASTGEIELCRTQETALGSKLEITRSAPLDAAGHFDAALECGSWVPTAVVPGSPQPKHVFEPVDIGRDGLERDLGLPGTRLRGRVLDAATRQAPAGCANGLRARLHRPGAKPTGNGVPLDEHGRFVIEMVEPGKWELTVESILPDATDHYEVPLTDPSTWELTLAPREPKADEPALEFTIDPADRERELEYFLRSP